MFRPALSLAMVLFMVGSASAETLLIGNKGEDTVSFVDMANGRERARVETGKAPHEIAVSPDGREAAVVAYGGSTIDIFDVRTARRTHRIDIAPNSNPHGIAWLRNGRIVATAEQNRSLVVVDPKLGAVRAIPLEQTGSHLLALSPDQRTAYVTNIGSGTVSVVDLRRGTKLRDLKVGGFPEGIAITRNGRQLWVGDDSAPRVRVVDIASGRTLQTLPTDSVALRIAISPDGRIAVVSNMATGTLNVFDVASRRRTRTISVSGDKAAMQVTLAFIADGRRVLVAETGRDSVAEVDIRSGTVLRRIAAGRNGDGLAIAP